MNKPRKTRNAGGVVVNSFGPVALVQNGPGAWWGFPKGHIDDGEDAVAAARREIREETGLSELVFVRPLGAYERFKGVAGGGEDRSELKCITMFLFRVDNASATLTPEDPGNPEARWVLKTEVASFLTNGKDRDFFLSIFETL